MTEASWQDWNKSALRPYIDLIQDIMKALVNDSSEFIRQFNINYVEADILALFLVHSYGSLADFQTFLKIGGS